MSSASLLGSAATTAALLAPAGTQSSAAVPRAAAPLGGTALLSAAAVRQGTGTGSDAQVELAWSHDHPDGRAATDDLLILWNFDVSSSTLKTEHEQALRSFVRVRQLNPAAFHLLASGYASSTGGEGTNERLREARARAVADWCETAGFPDVGVETALPGSPDLPAATERGGQMAQARAVMLQVLSVDGADEPAAPPRLALLTSPTEAPVVADCGSKIDISFKVDDLAVSFPDNPWVVNGKAAFTGTIKATFGDARACRSAQLEIKRDGAALKLKDKVAGQLGSNLSGAVLGATKVSASSVVGDGPWQWEFGVQVDAKKGPSIVIKLPELDFTDLLPDRAQSFDWNGVPVAVSVRGRFELSGLPGPAMVALLEEWAAGLAAAAPELVVLAGVAGSLAFLYLVVDAAAEGDAHGLARAAALAQQMGYVGQLAAVLAHPDDPTVDDKTVEQYLALYDDPKLVRSGIRDAADSGRQQVMLQLAALGDQRAARVAELHAAYAVDGNGSALPYIGVIAKLRERTISWPMAEAYDLAGW